MGIDPMLEITTRYVFELNVVGWLGVMSTANLDDAWWPRKWFIEEIMWCLAF